MPSSSARGPKAWRIVCDRAELALEWERLGSDAGALGTAELSEQPIEQVLAAIAASRPAAIALASIPTPAQLVALASAARDAAVRLPLAVVVRGNEARSHVALACDLGLVAVREVRPLASAVALAAAAAQRPAGAAQRGISSVDRARLESALSTAERSAGKLVALESGAIGWATTGTDRTALGEARDVAEAIAALTAAETAVFGTPVRPDGVDPDAVLDVIFGPPRALSDPASKAALKPYGVPLPIEELCTSPSRAASEATRIGFPVRIALASPDLRVWDHPDLAVDHVDNAARVRDVFRQLTTLAEARAPSARLLGVTVAAASLARAELRVRATPLEGGLVLARIGFADPHGLASRDETLTVLASSPARVESAIERLAGGGLVLDGTSSQRRRCVGAIADVLGRVAAFVHDRRAEVESVELHPLALVVTGDVEVREACITVNDAFAKWLDQPAAG